jgi:hypothetical protein
MTAVIGFASTESSACALAAALGKFLSAAFRVRRRESRGGSAAGDFERYEVVTDAALDARNLDVCRAFAHGWRARTP